MKQHAWLLALGFTLVLAALFFLPTDSDRATATPYAPMEGKMLAQLAEPAKPPEPAAPVTTPTPPAAAPRAKPTKRSRRMKAATPPKSKEPALIVAVSTQTSAVPTPAAAPPTYTYESIADKYENDPSNFSLDRVAKTGDVTLRLLGLERLAEAFVLKVAVANDSSSDFYVKGFVVQAGAKTLISRFYFRILIESQRAREGYIVFEKPQTGAAVKIKIEEEGGKGRSLSSQVPYPF